MALQIPDDKKEEIRERADLVEVVQDYVKLKRSGRNWKGLCPFHDEKTPSFYVTPSMGIYKCFGCGASGDVFNFMMEMEGIGFVEAMRSLAERFNVSLPEADSTEEFDETHHLLEGIYHALKYAGVFFHRQLAESDEAEAARQYLQKRGYGHSTIKKYGLGYAPKRGGAFYQAALDSGLNETYLLEAGLIKASDRNGDFYDAFRGRLMFPIFNASGKVIAYAGRALRKADKAKYINSPQTKVYNKSEVLYGVNFAKNEIRKSNEAILVEGYTDVISLHQNGIENVVASSGTSLTAKQLKLLKRYGDALIMIYDSDSAGRSAMKRGLHLALQEGLEVKLLELTEGEDPDSFIRQFGKASFLELQQEKTENYVSYLVHRAQNEGRWDEPADKKETISEVLECIARMPNNVAREAFLQHLSSLSEIGLRTLQEELGPVTQKITQEKLRTQQRQQRLRKKKKAPENGDGFLQNTNEKKPRASAQNPYDLSAPRPGYEKEIIRLMLSPEKNRDMIEYIGSNFSDQYFEDNQLRTFYLDIIQRYKDNEKVSVEYYASREHPYPRLVGEIMLEEHEVSERHREKVGVQIKRDKNPYLSAKGALKSGLLEYINRKQRELQQRYGGASEEQRKTIIRQMKEIARKRTRLQKLPFDEVFPDPEKGLENQAGSNIFEYEMKK
jgi:DNA primase